MSGRPRRSGCVPAPLVRPLDRPWEKPPPPVATAALVDCSRRAASAELGYLQIPRVLPAHSHFICQTCLLPAAWGRLPMMPCAMRAPPPLANHHHARMPHRWTHRRQHTHLECTATAVPRRRAALHTVERHPFCEIYSTVRALPVGVGVARASNPAGRTATRSGRNLEAFASADGARRGPGCCCNYPWALGAGPACACS